MFIPIVSLLTGVLGWRLIPDLILRVLLPYFHRLYSFVLRRPAPAPGSPLWQTHRRFLYALVVFSYMIYNFEKAANAIGPNYYEMLGVTPTADDHALRMGFRAFAKKHHPDRGGPDKLFVKVRSAYEALKNPVTRFAYDRCAALCRLSDSSVDCVDTALALMRWNGVTKETSAPWGTM